MSYAFGSVVSQAKDLSALQTQKALESVLDDPSLAAKLSPVTKALTSLAVDQIEILISDSSVDNTFSSVVSELETGSTLSSVLGTASDVASIFGAFTKVLQVLFDAANKTRAEAEAKVNQFHIVACQDTARRRPQKSGSSGILPADIFMMSDGGPSSVGMALMALTEPLISFGSGPRAPKGGAAPLLVSAERAIYPATGLSAAEQSAFYTLRLAIQDSYMRGNGGISIWPAYVDLFRAAVKSGKFGGKVVGGVLNLDLNYASAVINYAEIIEKGYGGIRSKVEGAALATSGQILGGFSAQSIWDINKFFVGACRTSCDSCFPVWGHTMANSALELARRAEAFLFPKYDQDKIKLAIVAQKIEDARRLAPRAVAQPRPLRATRIESFPWVMATLLVAVGVGGAAAYRRQRYGRIL